MCRATEGDRPVYWLTWAASAIFSSMVRGVPGVVNTRNRVPELPNAHEGSSILWVSSWARTCALMLTSCFLLLVSRRGRRADLKTSVIGGDRHLRHHRNRARTFVSRFPSAP